MVRNTAGFCTLPLESAMPHEYMLANSYPSNSERKLQHQQSEKNPLQNFPRFPEEGFLRKYLLR